MNISITGPVYETMRKFNLVEHNENHFFAMFPTVADAVHFARSHSEVPSTPAWSTCIHDENYISRLWNEKSLTRDKSISSNTPL